ncbi:hypothetical protein BACFIN_09036, partial [Bacteroides finegoldii DSM 17565]
LNKVRFLRFFVSLPCVFILDSPPFWLSNRFLGGMLKDTKKATNSQ